MIVTLDEEAHRAVTHRPRHSVNLCFVDSPVVGRAASVDSASCDVNDTFPGVKAAAIEIDENAVNVIRRATISHMCDGEGHESALPERLGRSMALSGNDALNKMRPELAGHLRCAVAAHATSLTPPPGTRSIAEIPTSSAAQRCVTSSMPRLTSRTRLNFSLQASQRRSRHVRCCNGSRSTSEWAFRSA